MTKIKIALAVALFAATGSAALAQSNHVQKHRNVYSQSAPVLQQRSVALPTEGRSAAGPFWYNGSGPSSGGM